MWRTVREVLIGDQGAGPLLGSLLMVVLGSSLMTMSAAEARAAFAGPAEVECVDWLASPRGQRWVTLSGCRLDLAAAASRSWHGLGTHLGDGGVVPTTLGLFVPIAADDEHELPPRAVLATSDATLLRLVDGLARQPLDGVDAYIAAHRAELEAQLKPASLSGFVEPVASLSSRAALAQLAAPGAVVLEQGRAPRRANALFGVVLGLFLAAGGLLPIFRRYLLWVELKKLSPPPEPPPG